MELKHGCSSGYDYRKCRCDECVAWKQANSRRYYEQNRERIKAQNAAWAKANRKKLNEADRRRRAANLEVERTKDRKRYLLDKEGHYRRQRRWEKRNPWRVWFIGWKRRETERGQVYDDETLDWIRNLDSPQCTYCLRTAQTIDHIVPRTKGGTNDRQNLAPSCHRCNKMKGTMDLNAFLKRLSSITGEE